MPDDYDPRPIPETIRYNGSNADEIVSWAAQTLDHYEQRHVLGYTHPVQEGTLRTPDLQLFEQASHSTVILSPGSRLTYAEKGGFRVLTPHEGPEILARDHPMTVAEARLVQDAQRKLGVGIPEPGEMDFVNRRAAATNLSAPTITDPAQLEAMQRHPSNALIRRSVAERYALTNNPGVTPGNSVNRIPPRIRPV